MAQKVRVERLAFWWPAAVQTPALVRCEGRIEGQAPEESDRAVLVAGDYRFESTTDQVLSLAGLAGRLPINLHSRSGTA